MPKPANDNSRFLAADVADLAAQIDGLFAAYPDLAEDEQLRADMLEGETNLHAVLGRLLSVERDANSMADAAAKRLSDLSARKARYERKQEAMRSLLLRLMKAGSLTRVPLTEATISIRGGSERVEITDETAVPARFLKVVKTPDKTAIKAVLKTGKKVKGAELKTGDDTIAVKGA